MGIDGNEHKEDEHSNNGKEYPSESPKATPDIQKITDESEPPPATPDIMIKMMTRDLGKKDELPTDDDEE